ncbi:MAG: NifU family protein [bacterium]|nr:NifU family protein [bacterium]
MQEKIEELLEEVRPALARHMGNVEFVSFDAETGVVSLRFQGTCAGCPLSELTLKHGIESVLCEALPEVKEVVAVK